MSFLKKLRDRMFRSSDKISEGLEALVGDAPLALAGETPVAPSAAVQGEAAPAPESGAKPSLLGRLLGRDETRRLVDDAMLESLEDLLIQADMGVQTAAYNLPNDEKAMAAMAAEASGSVTLCSRAWFSSPAVSSSAPWK